LPKVLQDYVLLHELCHLRHPDHGHGFHLLLEHLLTDNIMRLLNQPSDQDPDHALTKELARKAATSKAAIRLTIRSPEPSSSIAWSSWLMNNLA
jgi:hypothetical protein